MRVLLLIALLAANGAARAGSDAWSMAANMSTPRAIPLSAVLQDGSVLIAGGSAEADYHLTSAEIYDPQLNAFALTGSMATPRHDGSATTLQDGRVLVVGGYNANSQWLGDAELFDPVSGTWSVVPPLFPHGVSHSATLLNDGRVLLVCGAIGSGEFSQQAELFDPASGTWTAAAQPGWPRGGHTATLLQDGRVLVVGGSSGIGDTAASAEVYDPASDTWTTVGSLNQGRSQHQALRLADGRVLVAGGSVAVPTVILNSAEAFDPVTETWQVVGSMTTPRTLFTLTALPDGNAIAVGGVTDYNWSPASFTRSVEVFDALGNTWSTEAPLNVARCMHTAALLRDGRTFVAGGNTAGFPGPSGYLASTEVLELIGDREITRIGFSNRVGGPQDTVVFTKSDTLYVRVQDVDAEKDPRTTVRFMLQHAGGVMTVTLARNADGIYTGSVSLQAVRTGPAIATVTAFTPDRTRLVKSTAIAIVAN